MTNFLNKLMKNTNRIIHNQVMNAPDFRAEAVKVTGGKKPPKRFDELEIKLRKGRGKSFKRHLEKTHPSTRDRIELE